MQVTLDWKVTNLKHLFESSKGDSKSKCVKSALFDSHRWQVRPSSLTSFGGWC